MPRLARWLAGLLAVATLEAHALAGQSALAPLGMVAKHAPPSLVALRLTEMQRRDRTGHAVLGGAIGAATGIVACTVISNLVKDPGSGFSTCTTKGYLGFALGGAALGALLGWLLR
ncbi:MAG TPA: hypothetical protein VGP61_07825 [Gemmatimonadales bacterium]|jgi:hypothetical protein|nr:hypothetical protein [Gemmatimonadales bacterium]